jgi:hypothetical protein
MSDAYAWTAHYRDGAVISQIDADGHDTGSWGSVDPKAVRLIALTPLLDGLPLHGVVIPDGASAYLSWRRTQELDPNTGRQFAHPEMLVVGWTLKKAASYLFIDHDGNTLCAPSLDAI